MKHYHAKFIGRTKGAIGIFYPIEALTKGVDEEAARLALFDDYEHIQQLKLVELLPSQQNTRAMERRIRKAVRAMGYRGDLVFEHGHWWLMLPDGSAFDVVDASGGNSVDGFGLERVS